MVRRAVVGGLLLVFGTLGDIVTVAVADAGVQPTRYTWLIDDTEGNGALAIRVELVTTAQENVVFQLPRALRDAAA